MSLLVSQQLHIRFNCVIGCINIVVFDCKRAILLVKYLGILTDQIITIAFIINVNFIFLDQISFLVLPPQRVSMVVIFIY